MKNELIFFTIIDIEILKYRWSLCLALILGTSQKVFKGILIIMRTFILIISHTTIFAFLYTISVSIGTINFFYTYKIMKGCKMKRKKGKFCLSFNPNKRPKKLNKQ